MNNPLFQAALMRRVNAAVMIVVAVWFFLLPGVFLVSDLTDPALRQPTGIPRAAWRVHRSLSPRYERWARERIASGKAAEAELRDVVATEWAMFGSVFYLAATENLQREWERHPGRPVATAPAVYARRAIEAATDLVLDPVHHTWVKTHWGSGYLHRENVFFRAMLIQAMVSRENLLHDGKHLDVLRDQVETLSAALDASPHGILNDYPDECYPVDVFAAVTMIRRADAVLGTDHRAFAERERRAFQGRLVDEWGLPGYFAYPELGVMEEPSRGIGNSYVCIYCPELYPDWARRWYDRYVEGFWQQRIGAAGFREYASNVPEKEWFYDVDAGPVIDGFGPAANAYGVAAARVNGRFDHAWTLSSQVLAASWPLPGGVWLGARILSNAVHAPYLGEANLLFLFTSLPADGTPVRTGGYMPPLVYVGFLFYFGLGLLILTGAIRAWRNAVAMPAPAGCAGQFVLWAALAAGGGVFMLSQQMGVGGILILLAQLLPRDSLGRPCGVFLLSLVGLAVPAWLLHRGGDAGFGAVICLFSGDAFGDRPIVTGGALDQFSLHKEIFIFCISLVVWSPFLLLVRRLRRNLPRGFRNLVAMVSLLTLVHPLSILTIFTWDVFRYMFHMGITLRRLEAFAGALVAYVAMAVFARWLGDFKRPGTRHED